MFTRFAPSARIPPSLKTRHWTITIPAIESAAAWGPKAMARNVAPTKWPLVPGRTGKLTICAAKTKAPTTPRSGTLRSSSSARTLYDA